jgi:hypothetical protein
MTKDEALKLALEALEIGLPLIEDFGSKEQLNTQHKAIAAIYEALAQPEQEPVGWLDSNDQLAEFMHKDLKAEHDKRNSSTPRDFQIPVYTTPPQRTWVGLTKEERHEISMANRPYCADVMAAHEEELKRRNT